MFGARPDICECYKIFSVYKFLQAESFCCYTGFIFDILLKDGVFDGLNKCFSNDFCPLAELFYILLVFTLFFICLLSYKFFILSICDSYSSSLELADRVSAIVFRWCGVWLSLITNER